MEEIIKAVKCDPAKIIADAEEQRFVITADVLVEADVNAMYNECVKNGFNPSSIVVWSGHGDDTLASLKEAGVSSVSFTETVNLASTD